MEQASDGQDPEQVSGIFGVDGVWDGRETSAGLRPLFRGGPRRAWRFQTGMVCVDCIVLPSSMGCWALCGGAGLGFVPSLLLGRAPDSGASHP